MTNEEIHKMCQILARKYKDAQERDDLVSEGFLKCLELREAGVTKGSVYHKAAAVAMNEYYNIKKSVVSVPVHSISKSIKADTENVDRAKDWTAYALQTALYGEVVEHEDYMSQTPSSEDLYIQAEWLAKVFTTAFTVLTQDEWAIIRMRYWDDMTQDDVGKIMVKNKMWVSRHEKTALEKIRNNL